MWTNRENNHWTNVDKQTQKSLTYMWTNRKKINDSCEQTDNKIIDICGQTDKKIMSDICG